MAKNKAPKSESARERFLRLATSRTDAAIKRISLLGNLAGSGYEYEPGEPKQIIDALQEALDEVESKFSRKKADKKETGFSFTTNNRRSAA